MVITSRTETLIDRLVGHAATTPHKIAYTFLQDDGCRAEISYSQLQHRVLGGASALRDRFPPGERLLLLFSPGIEFVVGFLACLAAGVIAVPAYPPRKNRSIHRLESIYGDARPAAILTARRDLAGISEQVAVQWPKCSMVAIEELERSGGFSSADYDPPSDSIAFLQYTSGSTANPRGVIVTHANLVANERQIQASFQQTPDSIMVSWLPLFHDMGLVGGVLQPLFVGGAGVLLSPMKFLRDPICWLQAVTDFRGTTTGAPNFAFEHCVDSIPDERISELDLSSLRVAYNGAEPVRDHTLRRFAAKFRPCGFREEAFFPCYGLAESTLLVSGGPPGRGPRTLQVCPDALAAHKVTRVSNDLGRSRCLVSSGLIAEGTEVIIVDPESGEVCKPGMVGEIWLASDSVAQGYWNNEPDTLRTFNAVPISGNHRKYLRTGDTGFLDSGELFVTGRIKDVIIARGRNLYPQDIEAIVEPVIPFARPNTVVAFGLQAMRSEVVGIVAEAHRGLLYQLGCAALHDAENQQLHAPGRIPAFIHEVREIVSRTFDVTADVICLVRPGSFFRTSSGKLQRSACKAAWLSGTLDLVFSWQSSRLKVPGDEPITKTLGD